MAVQFFFKELWAFLFKTYETLTSFSYSVTSLVSLLQHGVCLGQSVNLKLLREAGLPAADLSWSLCRQRRSLLQDSYFQMFWSGLREQSVKMGSECKCCFMRCVRQIWPVWIWLIWSTRLFSTLPLSRTLLFLSGVLVPPWATCGWLWLWYTASWEHASWVLLPSHRYRLFSGVISFVIFCV